MCVVNNIFIKNGNIRENISEKKINCVTIFKQIYNQIFVGYRLNIGYIQS